MITKKAPNATVKVLYNAVKTYPDKPYNENGNISIDKTSYVVVIDKDLPTITASVTKTENVDNDHVFHYNKLNGKS